jgi:hypothetical protein
MVNLEQMLRTFHSLRRLEKRSLEMISDHERWVVGNSFRRSPLRKNQIGKYRCGEAERSYL